MTYFKIIAATFALLQIANAQSVAYQWIASTGNDPLPTGAFYAGRDINGDDIYVGYVKSDGCNCNVAAAIIPAKKYAISGAYGYKTYTNYYVLVVMDPASLIWRPSMNGSVPTNGVMYGTQNLFVGRISYQGGYSIGHINTVYKRLYYGFKGAELSKTDNYEALVVSPPDELPFKWVASNGNEPLPSGAFFAGKDSFGDDTYVGYVISNGYKVAAAINPTKKVAISGAYGYKTYENYSVLVVRNQAALTWRPSFSGTIPTNGISTDIGSNYELYIGRISYQNGYSIGHINTQTHLFYYGYQGIEYPVSEFYEALVQS